MNKLYLICLLIFSFFVALSLYINSGFIEPSINFPEVSEPTKVETRDYSEEFSTDIEIPDLMKILKEEEISGLRIPAWSLYIDTYNSLEEVNKNFRILKSEGYKAYIREDIKKQDIFYKLFIGPNMDKKEIEKIKDQIYDLLGAQGKVVIYSI